MSSDKAFQEMCNAHVGVVSLSPDIFQYAFPSKVLTYMSANLPMLAMVEDESQLAKSLHERRIGANVDWSGTTQEIVVAIRSLITSVRQGNMFPAEHTDVYHQNLAKEKWLSLLSDLETSKGIMT